MNLSQKLEICAFGVISLFVAHLFYIIAVMGDSYPHWDEWEYILIKVPMWKHFFGFYNENLHLFSSIFYSLIAILGLPFKTMAYFSGIVYVGLVAVYYVILRKIVPENRRFFLLLMLIPLFSLEMIDNVLWPMLIQTSFYFLFMMLAVYYGFMKPQTLKCRALAFFMLGCSILAMNISFAVMFVIFYGLKNIYNAKTKDERHQEILLSVILLSVTAIVCTIFVYFMQQSSSDAIHFETILTVGFYQKLAYGILSPMGGFNFSPESLVWLFGLIVFAIVLGGLFFMQFHDVKKQGVWMLVLLLCGGMAAIVLLRGNDVYHMKEYTGRYLFYGYFLIAAIFSLGWSEKRILIRRICDGLAVVVLSIAVLNFHNNPQLQITKNRIERGKVCIEAYYKQERQSDGWYCLSKYPYSLEHHLVEFKKKFLD